ncbi:MAG TPA: hypothetical protein P5075_09085 [Eubacteriales bacterium]|nr:hypothetical protein [Eubacteriales bacterium]
MNNPTKVVLCNSMIHIDIGIRRFSGDEDLYEKHLKRFLNDRYFGAIKASLGSGNYLQAERFSQKLKVKSYHLGMVRLAKCCDALCTAIRLGKGTPDFPEEMRELAIVYGMMQDCIQKAFFTEPSEKQPG